MSRIDSSTSREKLAAIVSKHFQDMGLDVVLVGGAVVSIYTDDYFPSDDLDFVAWKTREVLGALKKLGFTKLIGNRAEHPDARFYVQVVNAPVAVGRKVVREPAKRKTKWGEIRLLSPLDCVLDRLSAFLHWNDRQCLLQAVHVAAKHHVELSEVRAWVEEEEGERRQNRERFAEFEARVAELIQPSR